VDDVNETNTAMDPVEESLGLLGRRDFLRKAAGRAVGWTTLFAAGSVPCVSAARTLFRRKSA
jgi:hypothetical protein